jgi:hypothetical protein
MAALQCHVPSRGRAWIELNESDLTLKITAHKQILLQKYFAKNTSKVKERGP